MADPYRAILVTRKDKEASVSSSLNTTISATSASAASKTVYADVKITQLTTALKSKYLGVSMRNKLQKMLDTINADKVKYSNEQIAIMAARKTKADNNVISLTAQIADLDAAGGISDVG